MKSSNKRGTPFRLGKTNAMDVWRAQLRAIEMAIADRMQKKLPTLALERALERHLVTDPDECASGYITISYAVNEAPQSVAGFKNLLAQGAKRQQRTRASMRG